MARFLRFFVLAAAVFAAAAQAQQWTPFAIPNGMSFVVGAGDSPVLLAVQFDPGKAVRSTDRGQTWTPVDVAGQRPIQFIASPTDPAVFYALSGSTGLAIDPPPRALYRSNDAGKTWQLVTPRIQTPAGAVIDNIRVGAQPDLLWGSRMAATVCFTGSCSFEGAEGYVSSDAGRTWRKSEPSTGTGAHQAFPSPSDARVAYVTNHKGLFRTDDQGASWRMVLQAQPASFIYERQVLVDRFDPDIVYGRLGSGPELWVTEDGGRLWRTSTLDIPGGWQQLVADPLESGRIYAVGAFGDVFQSRDRARSWQRVSHSAGTAATNVNRTKPMLAVENGQRVVYTYTLDGPQRVRLFDTTVLGADLWWNPRQSGWGLSLTHHASGQLFGVWFTYDAQGDPTWRVMPGGTWTDAHTFSATIYATHGPAFFSGPVFEPAKVTVTPVGQATLVFDGDSNAVFRWRLDDGSAGETPITRQLFGPPMNAGLADFADLWWNPAASGWGVAVAQQYANAFAVLFVYDDAGRPTWVVMPDAVYGGKYLGSEFVYGFHGNLYTTKGPPSSGPFDPSKVIVTPAGQATLRFDNFTLDAGAVTYDAFGRRRTEPLARQPF